VAATPLATNEPPRTTFEDSTTLQPDTSWSLSLGDVESSTGFSPHMLTETPNFGPATPKTNDNVMPSSDPNLTDFERTKRIVSTENSEDMIIELEPSPTTVTKQEWDIASDQFWETVSQLPLDTLFRASMLTGETIPGICYIEADSKQALIMMANSFPDGEYENWGICAILVSQAQKILEHGHTEPFYQQQQGLLSCNVAYYFWRRGYYTRATKYALAAVSTQERLLGPEHPDTLTSLGYLASTYWDQGRLDKAEELDIQVVEARKRVLGLGHPVTLTCMNNLALTYLQQERIDEAEAVEVQVLEARKRVLRPEHPDILTSMNNLASTYWDQGRWDEAEELNLQVVEARRRVVGPEHPDTLTSIANLASTYAKLGEIEKAIDLFEQCLSASARVLGENHPDTMTRADWVRSLKRD
jgi:tetratricopeptide (TPR) repeat protein